MQQTKTTLAIATLAVLLCAQALSAYTIILKDGTTIIALKPFESLGDQALVTLPSGTQTSYPLAEIDLEKTAAINRLGVTSGLIISSTETKILQQREIEERNRQQTLESLAQIARRNRGRDMSSRENDPPAPTTKTKAGNLDLFTLQRNPPLEEFMGDTLNSRLRQHNLQRFGIFEGSRKGILLLDLTADNETEVFAGIQAAAVALLETREELTDLIAIELILSTSRRSKAGQFLLTPMAAQDLVDGSVSTSDYFVRNVQF